MNKMGIFLGLAWLVFSLSTSSFAAAGPGYGRKFATPRFLLARAEDSLQMPFAEPAAAAAVGVGGMPSGNMGMDKRQLSIIPNTYFLDADYTSNSGSGSGTGYQYLPLSSILGSAAATGFGSNNWNNYWNANSVNRNVLPYTYYYYVNPAAAPAPAPAIPPPAPAPVSAPISPVVASLPMPYYYSTPYLWGNVNPFPHHGLQFQLQQLQQQQQQQQQHYSPSSVPSASSSSYDQPILKF